MPLCSSLMKQHEAHDTARAWSRWKFSDRLHGVLGEPRESVQFEAPRACDEVHRNVGCHPSSGRKARLQWWSEAKARILIYSSSSRLCPFIPRSEANVDLYFCL